MAMSTREQTALAGLLLVGIVVGGGFMFALPQVQAAQAKTTAKTTLEAEVKDLGYQAERMTANIQDYQVKLDTMRHLDVKTYQAGHPEKSVKAFIDEVVDLAAQSGNEIISLVPYDTAQPDKLPDTSASATPASASAAPTAEGGVAPATVSVAQGAAATANAANASTTANVAAASGSASAPAPAAAAPVASGATPDEKAVALNQAIDAKPLPLYAAGYTLEVRGGYGQVLAFMKQLKQFPDLLEVESFKLTNEAGPGRDLGGSADTPNNAAGSHLNPNKPIKLTLKLRLFLMEEKQAALFSSVPPSAAGTPMAASIKTP
jgi:Tfp pilus assembly protein PilO